MTGRKLEEGASVQLPNLLLEIAVNRDPESFSEPDKLNIQREDNPHLAFGFGPHFCLGAQLARLETRALFAELLPRLETIELAGTPTSSATVFVGGLKTLPIRYRVRA